MTSIGVRELRQQASHYLRLVAAGEHIEVTDRGRPVAMLVPIDADPWEVLVVSGQVVVAPDEADILDEVPVDYGVDASGRLATMRGDER